MMMKIRIPFPHRVSPNRPLEKLTGPEKKTIKWRRRQTKHQGIQQGLSVTILAGLYRLVSSMMASLRRIGVMKTDGLPHAT